MIISLQDKQTAITNPEAIHAILQEILKSEDEADQYREHFWVFQLDTRQRIKQLELVSLGILNASLVHPREVFTKAIANRCSSILLAHNHPSGDAGFSPADVETTKRLIEAGKILGIEVVDHVITTVNGYASYREQNLM